MLFPTFTKIAFCEKLSFTCWLNERWFLQVVDIGNFNMKLNGRWFPQIVDRDSGNLYPIYPGGEGGVNFCKKNITYFLISCFLSVLCYFQHF